MAAGDGWRFTLTQGPLVTRLITQHPPNAGSFRNLQSGVLYCAGGVFEAHPTGQLTAAINWLYAGVWWTLTSGDFHLAYVAISEAPSSGPA